MYLSNACSKCFPSKSFDLIQCVASSVKSNFGRGQRKSSTLKFVHCLFEAPPKGDSESNVHRILSRSVKVTEKVNRG